MMKLYPYWPWIVGVVFLLAWGTFHEVRGAQQGSGTVMLTVALRDFTVAFPQWPYLAGYGIVTLAWHLWGPPLRGLWPW